MKQFDFKFSLSCNKVFLFHFQVKAYLRSHHISKELRQRIDNWYQHLHINKKIMRENEILQQLPLHLRTEIAVSVHLPTLSKVTIFQSCEKSLLEELVLKLTPQVSKLYRTSNSPGHLKFNCCVFAI